MIPPASPIGFARGNPTRLVDTISGYRCCHSFGIDNGDVLATHTYIGPGVQLSSRTQAAEVGEFGGLGLDVLGRLWPGRPFAYKHESDSSILTQRYVDLMKQVSVDARHFGLNTGTIYTAATDVENEVDGLVTSDRGFVKMDMAKVRAVNEAVIAAGSHGPKAVRELPGPDGGL